MFVRLGNYVLIFILGVTQGWLLASLNDRLLKLNLQITTFSVPNWPISAMFFFQYHSM